MTPNASLLLYAVFALGGLGLYLLLPKTRPYHPWAGALLGLAAVTVLFAALAARFSAGSPGVYFYLLAVVAVLGSAKVVTHSRPVYSALYFVVVALAVSAILVLQGAEFLAVGLLIIYAGAILVTYLFVIMLAHQGGPPVYDRRAREPFLAVLVGFVLMATIAARLADPRAWPAPGPDAVSPLLAQPADPNAPSGNTFAIGAVVMTRYIVVLELSGLLLLISMIGAIALSRRQTPSEVISAPAPPLGQIGREAAPF